MSPWQMSLGQMSWWQLFSVVYDPRTLCLKFDPNRASNSWAIAVAVYPTSRGNNVQEACHLAQEPWDDHKVRDQSLQYQASNPVSLFLHLKKLTLCSHMKTSTLTYLDTSREPTSAWSPSSLRSTTFSSSATIIWKGIHNLKPSSRLMHLA